MNLDNDNYVALKKSRDSVEVISLDTLLLKFFVDFIDRSNSINSSSCQVSKGSYYCASEIVKKLSSKNNNLPSDVILNESFCHFDVPQVLKFIQIDYGIFVFYNEYDPILSKSKKIQINYLVGIVISYIQNTYAEGIN